MLKSSTWGDSICLDMVSRLWGLRITVIDMMQKKERRIRHNSSLEHVDLVLIFGNDMLHYSAGVRRIMMNHQLRISGVPVNGFEDAPALEEEDTSDQEDKSDEEGPVAEWTKANQRFVKPWSYYEEPPRYTGLQGIVAVPPPKKRRVQEESVGVQAEVDNTKSTQANIGREVHTQTDNLENCVTVGVQTLLDDIRDIGVQTDEVEDQGTSSTQMNRQQTSDVTESTGPIQQIRFFCTFEVGQQRCSSSFASEKGLRNHIRDRHTFCTREEATCRHCSALLKNKKTRQQHEVTCKLKPGFQKFRCPYGECRKEYIRNFELNQHIRKKHTKQ